MTDHYFLGANSSEGFYSLYDGFCRGAGNYLSIIKGGPGTGKSGFMRRIGKAAERIGFDVEYVLCSGDRESLDGVYIPSLHRGWMDGTAPHSAEPDAFGVNGDYVNLSCFCKTPLAKAEAEEAGKLYKGYKAQYAEAYAFLKAASAVQKAGRGAELSEAEKRCIEKNISPLLPKRKHRGSGGKAAYRFLRCLSGEGETALCSEIENSCKKVYTLFGGRKAADYALKLFTREALWRGFSPIVALSPLNPNEYEAVLLRETETAALSGHYTIASTKSIALPAENIVPAEYAGQEKALLSSAYASLAEAKKLHDELEGIYKKAMDFDTLTVFTDSYIEKLFG